MAPPGSPPASILRFRVTAALIAVGLVLVSLALPAGSNPLSGLKDALAGALSSGKLGVALGIVFLAGVGTALTPCVYPMVAITVSLFGAREVKSKWRGAALSAVFVLGIATLFTPLGLAAASSGTPFAQSLSSPWVIVPIALFFVVLAISFFGAFELALPAKLNNKLSELGGAGFRGAFVLGLVSAIIAAPCTGPPLLFLLGWVGTTGNMVFGGLALFVFALGLGTLFFLVGTFAISLPKSGAWLEWVKSIFGVVMIAVAFYFVRDLLPGTAALSVRNPIVLGGGLGAIAVGILIGAIDLSFHLSSMSERIRKAVGIIIVVGGTHLAVLYLAGVPAGARIAWSEDITAARERARREGRPLIIDFGASWCGACGELDRHTFSDPRVVSESARFIALHVDLSPGRVTREKQALLREYRQLGLPFVVLHHGSGAEAERVTEFIEPDAMLERMRRVQ